MKYFSRIILIALMISASLLLSGERLAAESVFLKDGRIVECTIVSESPSSMTVLEAGGKTSTLSRKNVMRVLYTRLYRGRLYIQKINGSVIEAYIIDEDQEHYILRSELNSPREFTVRREEVLFMTRKNPSALEGKVSLKYVDLSWRPPYTPDNPAKYYRIFLRTKGGDYTAAGETSGKKFRARGLLCNMEYYAIVTAVDKNGDESLPSNEVHFTTQKGRPSPPGRVFIRKITSDAGRVCTAHVEWEKAADPCGGAITAYGVYIFGDKEIQVADADGSHVKFPGYRLAGMTSANEFKVTGLKDRRRYKVKVTSIDNTRDESETGRTIEFNTGNILPEYPFPVSCTKYFSSGGREITAKLSWQEADDPDGTVAGYRVFKKINDAYGLIGSTDATEYEVRGLAPSGKHSFVVRSVDNRRDESEDSYPAATGLIRYASITARGSCLVPAGRYGRIYKQGYGASLIALIENLFFEGIGLGAEAGYFFLEGNKERAKEGRLVPFTLTASYRLPLARFVSIDPYAAFGGCYNTSLVNSVGVASPEFFFLKRYVSRSAVEPMFSAGVNFTFNIKKLALVQLGASYGGIIERGALMSFFAFSLGAGVRF